MKEKIYYATASFIFTVIATLHVIRAIDGWEAVIGGVVIPLWVSWAAAAIAIYMAVRGLQFYRREK